MNLIYSNYELTILQSESALSNIIEFQKLFSEIFDDLNLCNMLFECYYQSSVKVLIYNCYYYSDIKFYINNKLVELDDNFELIVGEIYLINRYDRDCGGDTEFLGLLVDLKGLKTFNIIGKFTTGCDNPKYTFKCLPTNITTLLKSQFNVPTVDKI